MYALIENNFIIALSNELLDGYVDVPDNVAIGDYFDGTNYISNTRWAWVKKGKIQDIAEGNPYQLFHRDIAAYYSTRVDDAAQRGWVLEGDVFVEPPQVIAYPTIGAVEFLLLFTSLERVSIRQARSTDPVIDDLLTIVEDPRTTSIDLSRKSNIDAIDYLIAQGHVAIERREEILTGTPV